MENPKNQRLSIIHWIGIFVLGGIILLVTFAESDSDRRARIEAEEKSSLALNKNDYSNPKSTHNEEVDILDLLDRIGNEISDNSENRALIYVNSFKVIDSEFPAYKSIFKTSHEAFISRPDADKDKEAYVYNVGRTEIWQAIFCKPEVRDAVKKYNLIVISANLENEKGKMQSMALCVSKK